MTHDPEYMHEQLKIVLSSRTEAQARRELDVLARRRCLTCGKLDHLPQDHAGWEPN